jgi:5-hydroxyisourate hydrolase-like protein (transthyretin family)
LSGVERFERLNANYREPVVTNAEGRMDALLLAGRPLRIGAMRSPPHRRLLYGARGGDEPVAILDVVPIGFAIAEPEAHYHVPLWVPP